MTTTSTGGGPTVSARRDATRSRILARALTHFSAQGFQGTSLQQVADDLGLTKAALYHHFRSKDALLEAILEPAFADLEARLVALEGAAPTEASRRRGLADYADVLLEHRAVLAFLNRDLSVLARPSVRERGEVLQRRVDAVLLGSDLDQRERVLVAVALSGMQGAVAAHPGVDAEVLREGVVAAAEAVLRVVRRHRRERGGGEGRPRGPS